MKITFNKYLVIFLLMPFLFMALIYASFSSELLVNGSAMLRVNADIRITNLKVIEQSNGAYETYSSEFNKNSTSIYVSLPNIDSTITYEVTIKNSSTISYDLSDLVIESNSNDNINYEIDIEVGEEIPANSEKNFTIKLYYNSESTPTDNTDTLVIKYEFIEHINSYVVATYDYTGSSQSFTAPYNGIYKIELWGAQGGGFEGFAGGKGGYVSGDIILNENKTLFVYVGENGVGATEQHIHITGGYNGGGDAMSELTSETGTVSTGGGATDIRLISGSWDNFSSLKSRIMIASGGGGSDYYIDKYNGLGGAGGGLIGYDGTNSVDSLTEEGSIGIGGTQIKGGTNEEYPEFPELNGGFGFGGNYAINNGSNSGAGGSGYYGGSSGHRYRAGGGGGSSYISGHNGCNAILESSTQNNIIHSNQSIHYSGYKFTNTIMIDGAGYNWTTTKGKYVGMPTHSGTNTMEGNTGNGYAKITFIERVY